MHAAYYRIQGAEREATCNYPLSADSQVNPRECLSFILSMYAKSHTIIQTCTQPSGDFSWAGVTMLRSPPGDPPSVASIKERPSIYHYTLCMTWNEEGEASPGAIADARTRVPVCQCALPHGHRPSLHRVYTYMSLLACASLENCSGLIRLEISLDLVSILPRKSFWVVRSTGPKRCRDIVVQEVFHT